MACRDLIDELSRRHALTGEQWEELIAERTPEDAAYAAALARESARSTFGDQIFFRGIVEFTNYCRNDCLYCGIRRSNGETARYRLTEDQILSCCEGGYELGFRTFVLQGGEDGWFSDERMCAVVSRIRREYPDCAITLSLGERSRESYQRLFDAGANRYLLRHETASEDHYRLLHPPELSLQHRIDCLYVLRDIGYQVGCGMMVGSPGQTVRHLAADMLFMTEFQPHMAGIGPFLPHHATPFRDEKPGDLELTLFLLSLTRLLLPRVLLPATTALGTVRDDGRTRGILAGCNVIMPNLSPREDRPNYMLYDGKPTDRDAAETLDDLKKQVEAIGYRMVVGRGDAPKAADKEEK